MKEQELFVQALRALGEGGIEVARLWVILHFAENIFCVAMILGTLCFVGTKIHRRIEEDFK